MYRLVKLVFGKELNALFHFIECTGQDADLSIRRLGEGPRGEPAVPDETASTALLESSQSSPDEPSSGTASTALLSSSQSPSGKAASHKTGPKRRRTEHGYIDLTDTPIEVRAPIRGSSIYAPDIDEDNEMRSSGFFTQN